MAILNNILSVLPDVGAAHNAKNLVSIGTPTQDILSGLVLSGDSLLAESAAMILDINDRYNPKDLLDKISETSAYKADASMAMDVQAMYENIKPVNGLNYRPWLSVYKKLSKYKMYESVDTELEIAAIDIPNDIFNIQLLESINDNAGGDELLLETLVGCIGRTQEDASKFIMNETSGIYNDRLAHYDVISESLVRYSDNSLVLPNSAVKNKVYYPSHNGVFPVGNKLFERVDDKLVEVVDVSTVGEEFIAMCESWYSISGKSDLSAFVISKGVTFNINEGLVSYGGKSQPIMTGDVVFELVSAGVDRESAARSSVTIKKGKDYYDSDSFYESVDIPGGITANIVTSSDGKSDIILSQSGTGITQHVASGVDSDKWIYENYKIDISGVIPGDSSIDDTKNQIKAKRLEMVNEAIQKVESHGKDLNSDILKGLNEHMEEILGVDKEAEAEAAVALSESLAKAAIEPKVEHRLEFDLCEAYVVNVSGVNHIRFEGVDKSILSNHGMGKTNHGYDVINEDNAHVFAEVIGKHVYESDRSSDGIEQFMIDKRGRYKSLLENKTSSSHDFFHLSH